MPCSDQCLTCSDSAQACTTCYQGQYLNLTSKKCVTSHTCPPADGFPYYYDYTDSRCKQCLIKGCVSCISNRTCQACQPGSNLIIDYNAQDYGSLMLTNNPQIATVVVNKQGQTVVQTQ